MKKSSHIHLGLLATLALSLTSCERKEMQRCIDDHQSVVDDSRCISNQAGYHWYYGGGGGYAPGTYVSGGSYSPHSGYSGVTSSSVSRGGFGGSGGHGGSGGE
ncbi:MAG TPA: hypothetical protein VKU42_14250 [Candidatus Angelobacter sp.]|nr:hypothetical protein [Candidatus Angelobacter sp.]